MPLSALQPNTIGGGSPNMTTLSNNPMLPLSADSPFQGTSPFMSSAQIINNLASQPASPAASPLVSAVAQKAAQAPQAEPESGLANVPMAPRNKYDEQFDEAQGLLSKALEEKKGISPTALALSRGFFAPTKTGSFGETLYNVAGEVGKVQDQGEKERISNLQARMALAQAGSTRQKEIDSEQLLSQLYKKTDAGYKIDPLVAQKLSATTRDPKYLQAMIAEQQQDQIKSIGQNMFKQTIVKGKDGEPDKTVLDFNPNAIYDLAKVSPDPIKAISDYAKMVPELRKAGMINGLQTDATPFDSLVMMAPTDAIKTQAQFLARQYQKGMIDDEKANTLAQQMLTMSTAHMDRQQQMQFQQGMQGLMMGMRQESQQQARERLDMQKEENAKKLTDEQKITYRSIVTPIINEGIKASTALASLGALQKIAQDAPSGYISGAYAKSVGALFNTDDNTALRELEALQKSLLTQIPRLPGSQSNFDAKNLEKSLGDLTDITMDNKQRLALISKIQQQFQRMQDRANEVQDTWESTKKLPKWTSERAPATGTPAPATTGPVVDFSALPSRRP